MVYVCFSYRNNPRSLYYSEYEYFDSSTKLPETLLLWDVTLPVTVRYNCAPTYQGIGHLHDHLIMCAFYTRLVH